jgi:hypothetical protein
MMGKMGCGYGSECHLLRWMGRHRNRLNQLILEELELAHWKIEWLDFNFNRQAMWPDAELTGLEFLNDMDYEHVKADWAGRWPGRGHNWDAVAWIADETKDANRKLLLVEAKAEATEVSQNCGAKNPASIQMISDEFDTARENLDVQNPGGDWMKEYYQFANRLAVLSFLDEHNINAHLLFVYFCGDLRGACRNSPESAEEWQPILEAQHDHIGTIGNPELAARVHKLFLPVAE